MLPKCPPGSPPFLVQWGVSMLPQYHHGSGTFASECFFIPPTLNINL